MRISTVKEIKTQEARVGLTPAGTAILVRTTTRSSSNTTRAPSPASPKSNVGSPVSTGYAHEFVLPAGVLDPVVVEFLEEPLVEDLAAALENTE